jgi:hypothetical protein
MTISPDNVVRLGGAVKDISQIDPCAAREQGKILILLCPSSGDMPSINEAGNIVLNRTAKYTCTPNATVGLYCDGSKWYGLFTPDSFIIEVDLGLGSDAEVIYNNAGLPTGEAGFEYEDVSNVLTVPKLTVSEVTSCDDDTEKLETGAGGAVSCGTIPAVGTVPNYTQSFTSQTSVTLTHELGTANVLVSCYDATDIWLGPSNVDIGASDPWDVVVTFLEAETGRCVINGNPNGRTNYTQAFSAQTSVTLTHSFGTANLIVGCYDSTDIQIEPASVDIDPSDPFDVVVTFLESETGRCVVNGISSVSRYATTFTAQTSITVTGATHGLGTTMLNVSCFDDADPRMRVEPDTVSVDDGTNDVVIAFLESETGKCVLQ